MHTHTYNYTLPLNDRSPTATPAIDPNEQMEGLQRTLTGQRAVLEMLHEAHIWAGKHMHEDYVADLTRDVLSVASFLNDEAQRELHHLWLAIKAYDRHPAHTTTAQEDPR